MEWKALNPALENPGLGRGREIRDFHHCKAVRVHQGLHLPGCECSWHCLSVWPLVCRRILRKKSSSAVSAVGFLFTSLSLSPSTPPPTDTSLPSPPAVPDSQTVQPSNLQTVQPSNL